MGTGYHIFAGHTAINGFCQNPLIPLIIRRLSKDSKNISLVGITEDFTIAFTDLFKLLQEINIS